MRSLSRIFSAGNVQFSRLRCVASETVSDTPCPYKSAILTANGGTHPEDQYKDGEPDRVRVCLVKKHNAELHETTRRWLLQGPGKRLRKRL